MKIFFHILSYNILPIFVLIFLGYFIGKRKSTHIYTLSIINLNIYLPVFVFVNLYTTEMPIEMMKVFIYAIIFVVITGFTARWFARMRGYDDRMTNALKNATMFYNAGNMGIPLVMTVFSSSPFVKNGQTPYLNMALAVQIMIYIAQNITMNTIGFFNAGRGNMHWKDTIKKILAMPTIYAIPLAFLMKHVPYDLTQIPIWSAIMHIKEGFVALILMTLGIQCAQTQMDIKNKEVYMAAAIRMVGGPILTLLLIYMMKFDGVIAQTILISSAAPTAVNTALMALEFDNCADYASQVVMASTLLSGIMLTAVIYMSGILFPVV
ncbi:hypothetical protein HNQ80_000498 [Anaerosolibacter carboniphilus]|uniref:AEC family transporter n=1 Tax=Anaerosolibacter carboniphilus TaxID=1417629 RepID=A0A841KQM4_9FIRM|nr:AEC family transporter [Anaerosolibacter carboniphilus]MBB6214418.1 hypothetical protein [Anaerosolibacter carboniphilus]